MAGENPTPLAQQSHHAAQQMTPLPYRPGISGGAPFPPSSQTDQVLLGYLQRRGYRQTAQALAHEAKIRSPEDMVVDSMVRRESNSRGALSIYGSAVGSMSMREYEEQYSVLRKWTESSLDMFKVNTVNHRMASL
jgi:hypothetical protein